MREKLADYFIEMAIVMISFDPFEGELIKDKLIVKKLAYESKIIRELISKCLSIKNLSDDTKTAIFIERLLMDNEKEISILREKSKS